MVDDLIIAFTFTGYLLLPVIVVRALLEFLIFLSPGGRLVGILTHGVGPQVPRHGRSGMTVSVMAGVWARRSVYSIAISVGCFMVARILERFGMPALPFAGVVYLASWAALYIGAVFALECGWLSVRAWISRWHRSHS